MNNKILFSFLFILPATGFAQDNIFFNKLQNAINDYSVKIDICKASRDENDLSSVGIKEIRDIVIQNPSVLSYLSEKAYNNCLQPERGSLAEAILYARTEDKTSPTFILAESTRKISFHPDFSDEIIFNGLTVEQQNKLLSINNLIIPFDALKLMDRIMDE
ncbi:hypothetical protein [Psychromonas antarctica]|uniref:hypothetical protein n=1 Tax=Psychromonas antarctica TaxID=67573 RepID=UPI001EE8308D|nr:hypothetical protein [Psychromonas antarctica]MCG6202922.1 hypothetical protein [Psychromonas antarctica]